jgi:hypothetical protein
MILPGTRHDQHIYTCNMDQIKKQRPTTLLLHVQHRSTSNTSTCCPESTVPRPKRKGIRNQTFIAYLDPFVQVLQFPHETAPRPVTVPKNPLPTLPLLVHVATVDHSFCQKASHCSCTCFRRWTVATRCLTPGSWPCCRQRYLFPSTRPRQHGGSPVPTVVLVFLRFLDPARSHPFRHLTFGHASEKPAAVGHKFFDLGPWINGRCFVSIGIFVGPMLCWPRPRVL